jgi:hypothetical protein
MQGKTAKSSKTLALYNVLRPALFVLNLFATRRNKVGLPLN